MPVHSIRRAVVLCGLFTSSAAFAASGLDGATLGLMWALPFAGILLSIALFPLLASHFWHSHFGKIAVFWALACAVPLWLVHGSRVAFDSIAHILLTDYLPFLIFVGALFRRCGLFLDQFCISYRFPLVYARC